MKEIKFRLIKKNKIVGYEYHIEDCDIEVGLGIYHQTKENHDNEELMSKMPIMVGDKNYIFHDKKEMFIGFQDVNKKDLYDGDLVKSEVHMADRNTVMKFLKEEIKYSEFKACFCITKNNMEFPICIFMNTIEKVGDIHDKR